MFRKPRLVILPPQHLGHEIHVGRSIVVDMICKGILDAQQGDVVMTGLADRRFFYESLMGVDQVVDFTCVPGLSHPLSPPKSTSDYLSIPSAQFNLIERFAHHQIINLSGYALPPTYCTFDTSEEMANVGYAVPSRYWNGRFIELIQRFHWLSEDKVNACIPNSVPLYVMVHHRYHADTDKLKRILGSLPENLAKIIFTSDVQFVEKEMSEVTNLYFTNDLQTYTTLLHDRRCQLLVSEWSGAGQMAQYTLGPQGGIWYYYDHYPDVFNFTMTHKIWELNATLGNYFNCWDFKIASGCATKHFGSFDGLIGSLQGIRVNY